MKIYPRTRPIQRYIALDIHKEYVLAGGMNARPEWLLPLRRIEISKFGEWARKNLCESDAGVIETTTNVWDIYDIVEPLVGHAVVAHAGAVRQITEGHCPDGTCVALAFVDALKDGFTSSLGVEVNEFTASG